MYRALSDSTRQDKNKRTERNNVSTSLPSVSENGTYFSRIWKLTASPRGASLMGPSVWILVLVLLLIVVFAWNVNVWAEGERESKDAAGQDVARVKQDSAYTVTEKTTQKREEKNIKAQKNTRTEQDKRNNNKYYSITDELVCGGVEVKSIARCPLAHEYPLWQLECEQKLFIGEKILHDKPGITTLWGCIQDRKNSNYYIVIDFYSGGNCWGCEWTGIYDLEGNLIIDTAMDRTKCTLPRRRERTPSGFYDEFADCPEKLIKKREENIKKIKKLKQDNKEKFQVVNFEKGD